jgi:hypothetical protein
VSEQHPIGHFHAVQFYNDQDSLCRIVGGFLAEGIKSGHPAIVISTPHHTALIEAYLSAQAIDVVGLKRAGDLVTLDAHATLAMFMVDGLPNARAFRHNLTEVIQQVRRDREHVVVRAYGEMVDLLWKDGLEAAAIRLETLWNQLANSHDFRLLCGYSMGNFYKGAALEEIKGQHSHLVLEGGQRATIN